jgi:hypothetical protein
MPARPDSGFSPERISLGAFPENASYICYVKEEIPGMKLKDVVKAIDKATGAEQLD